MSKQCTINSKTPTLAGRGLTEIEHKMQNQAQSDHAILLNTVTGPHENLPEYVEAAAREIHDALHTFLLTPTILNPNGGPPLPWVSEIRIPAAKETNPKTGKVYTNVEAAWFDTDGIDDIAAELASRWCQPPELLGQYDKYAEGGIYWCINPITPAYLENYGSTLQRRKTGTARDVDVIARYWLPIDADALRKDTITGAPLSVVSSTNAEKASIARLIAQVRDWLVGTLGWPEPVRVDTGNGYADYYALPGIPIPRCPDPKNPGCLMHDAEQDTLIRDVINAISRKYSSALGDIDDTVFNPSRIMKIPGTFARKALHTPGRPHRASKILQYPASYNTCNTRSTATGGGPTDKDHDQGQDQTCQYPRDGPVEPTDEAERAKRIDHARGYLDKVPHAICGIYNSNGQKGHDAAFTGLGKVIRRFALTGKWPKRQSETGTAGVSRRGPTRNWRTNSTAFTQMATMPTTGGSF